MDVKKIDSINIVFIAIALWVAVKIPFELFLFSYAILGPLHYLTEIAWLDKKNYFFKAHKKWTIPLILLAVLVAVYPIFNLINIPIKNHVVETMLGIMGTQTSVFMLTGFLFSIGLLFFRKLEELLFVLLGAAIVSYLLVAYFYDIFIFVGVFLPTIIHVYFFTLLFILYGALRSKSIYGVFLALVLLAVPFVIVYLPVDITNYQPSEKVRETFTNNNLTVIGAKIAELLQTSEGGKIYLLSEIGIKIQIFITFSYTYHYLNWFSKTSIIGWRQALSKKNTFLIFLIWGFSVALYVYDYKIGFIALFFLSLLHVFLEFPLNVITIRETVILLKKKLQQQLYK